MFLRMKAYRLLDLTIHDLNRFKKYINKTPQFIHHHAGIYLAQGQKPNVMEGDWDPERIIVIEFPSIKHAKYFLADPDAKSLFEIRKHTTTSKLLLVEGCT